MSSDSKSTVCRSRLYSVQQCSFPDILLPGGRSLELCYSWEPRLTLPTPTLQFNSTRSQSMKERRQEERLKWNVTSNTWIPCSSSQEPLKQTDCKGSEWSVSPLIIKWWEVSLQWNLSELLGPSSETPRPSLLASQHCENCETCVFSKSLTTGKKAI